LKVVFLFYSIAKRVCRLRIFPPFNSTNFIIFPLSINIVVHSTLPNIAIPIHIFHIVRVFVRFVENLGFILLVKLLIYFSLFHIIFILLWILIDVWCYNINIEVFFGQPSLRKIHHGLIGIIMGLTNSSFLLIQLIKEQYRFIWT